jgi:hypothetical protein
MWSDLVDIVWIACLKAALCTTIIMVLIVGIAWMIAERYM